MTRKILADAGISNNWTSIAGALEGALRFLGTATDTATVMGLSGHAFRLAIETNDEGIAATESALRFDHQRAVHLYEQLGYAMQWIETYAEERDYERQRQQVVRRIQHAIDHGHPAIVYGLQLPEFGLVKGYDDRSHVWYVSTTVSPQYGESLPLAQWPAPGYRRWVAALTLDKQRRVSQREAVSAGLSFAVQYAEAGERGGPADTAHGFAAYERWLEGYAEPGSLARFGNARAIQTLQAARRDAAHFLRGLVTAYTADAGSALGEAAAAYEQEALALSRLATLFPYPGGGDPTSAGALAVGAASLRQAYAHEQHAIALLKAILANI